MAETIQVEVVFALPQRQALLTVNVPVGSTVQQAIDQSGIVRSFNEINLNDNKVGIWSRTVRLDDVVKQGDRIEIYRGLIADPKDMRKRRADKAKEEGRASKVTGGRPQVKRDDNDDIDE